jgi:hypothetical protein
MVCTIGLLVVNVFLLPESLVISGSRVNGTPREKLTLHICRKKGKTATVRLRNYVQAEDFMERLEDYQNLLLVPYDFDVDPESDPDDEE